MHDGMNEKKLNKTKYMHVQGMINKLCSNPQKYKPFLPKMYLSSRRIKSTYLKTMKLYKSTWLNDHLIFVLYM